MNILQIGYGKMGEFICNALKENPSVDDLIVCDINIKTDFEKNGIKFINNYDANTIKNTDCVFIATPASTHCNIIVKLIKLGAKNIYVEKPSVVNYEEYDEVQKIIGDCRIVCGYILRQAELLFALKRIFDKLYKDNFRMELCSVTYQKYLPYDAELRTKNDKGVYEEIVHIWDLIFNFLEFNKSKIKPISLIQEKDPMDENRIIKAKLSYLLEFRDAETLLIINSSFNAKLKKREFYFTLKDSDGNRRNIILSFDNADGNDKLLINDNDGKIVYEELFPSKSKLALQIEEVLHYFQTGEIKDLALFSASENIVELLNEAGIK